MVTYPLHAGGVAGEPRAEHPHRVPRVVKVSHLLPEERLERHLSDPRGEFLTRHAEHEHLEREHMELPNMNTWNVNIWNCRT